MFKTLSNLIRLSTRGLGSSHKPFFFVLSAPHHIASNTIGLGSDTFNKKKAIYLFPYPTPPLSPLSP